MAGHGHELFLPLRWERNELVFIWVPSGAEPGTRVHVGVTYLGLGPRKP